MTQTVARAARVVLVVAFVAGWAPSPNTGVRRLARHARPSTDKTAGGPAPVRRVTSDSRVPVRRQIERARAFKRDLSGTPARVERTRFRGNATTERALERARLLREDEAALAERAANGTLGLRAARPRLYVDGYNVIGGWARARRKGFCDDAVVDRGARLGAAAAAMGARPQPQQPRGGGLGAAVAAPGGLAGARRALGAALATLAEVRGWDVTVVFDAASVERGEARELAADAAADSPSPLVEVAFTSRGQSADAAIEAAVAEAERASKGTGLGGALTVATDDRMIRLFAGGRGAELMGTARLALECDGAARAVEQALVARGAAAEVRRASGSAGGGGDGDAGAGRRRAAAAAPRDEFERVRDELARRAGGPTRAEARAHAQAAHEEVRDLLRALREAKRADDTDERTRLLTQLRAHEEAIARNDVARTELAAMKRLEGLVELLEDEWWLPVAQRRDHPRSGGARRRKRNSRHS